MRWRNVIKGALLGALFGFTVQFSADSICWKADGTALAAEFARWHNSPTPAAIAFRPRLQAYFLLLISCCWCHERGEIGGRAALIGAFLLGSSVLAADHFRESRTVQKEQSVV
jgi:hypothetical protein